MEVATLFALAVGFIFSGVSLTMAFADSVGSNSQAFAAGEMADLRG